MDRANNGNTAIIILQLNENEFDIYELIEARFDEFGQFDEDSFESTDQLIFVKTTNSLPGGVRRIKEHEPTGPDYLASYVVDDDPDELLAIGVTCDMEYDLHQVVELPDPDEQPEARQHVIDHFGQIWADQVRRAARVRGYRAETYWGGDESRAHDIRTRTPSDGPYDSVEEELFQDGHDMTVVMQDDVDRIAAEAR